MRTLLRYPIVAGALCLLLVLVFHSPRWWLIVKPTPGTAEWDRATSYLAQCQAPFRADVEPAMRWRFVPQVFVFATGGNRTVALLIPWLGALTLAWSINRLLRQRGYDPVSAFWLGTVLLTSAPILVATGWLGMNDAWVALGLLAVAFSDSRLAIALACLVCPFIDERFVFGLPGAFLVRYYPFSNRSCASVLGRLLAAMLPFIFVRGIGFALGHRDNSRFLLASANASSTYLWVAPLALWMAWRFAYFPAALRIAHDFRQTRLECVLLLCGSLGPVLLGFTLASDTLRTASILLPLCVWGVVGPTLMDRRTIGWLAFASLVVPVAHVTYTKVIPINSSIVELWRLVR